MDMDMTFVKEIMIYVVEPFTHMYNLSFLTGIFPGGMKVARVISLYKSGDFFFLITDPNLCYLTFQKFWRSCL